MEDIVFIILQIFLVTSPVLKIVNYVNRFHLDEAHINSDSGS